MMMPGSEKSGTAVMMKWVRCAIVLLLAAWFSGCSLITPRTTVHQPMSARPIKVREAERDNGAIYQVDSSRPMMFDDRRARFVGDTLTVLIEEKTSASKKSSSTVGKTGSTKVDVPTISKIPLTNLQGASIDGTSATTFEGKGDSSTDNLFSGSLTVTVVDELANGNLLVSGEKQVTINHGTEYIRFSGVVNPMHISASNAVSSTKIADARIEYLGTGYIDEAQNMGWLSRVFMTVWPF